MSIKNLYAKLIQEYNKRNWQQVCSLDTFLMKKANSAAEKGNYELYRAILEVIELAEVDH